MKIGAIKVFVSHCTEGIYLRWWFNGWHYFNFVNDYNIVMKTSNLDIQTTNFFSVISKIERPTRIDADYDYKVSLEGIMPKDVGGFVGILMAEKVDQYEGGVWREVDIIRGEHLIRNAGEKGYIIEFTITRKELPITSAVYQKHQKLYLGDVLCDLDDDEVIPINKQVNDIAEIQDRQSDFTAQFRIRKTREMKDLFELSGEVGINTTFPYEQKLCKLIQDGIEIITRGNLILDRVDDQYYSVAIYSGNKSFFQVIDGLKITDLLLPTTTHIWSIANQVASHAADLDYVYPVCEPSDDGGITPMTDTGDYAEVYGGWIWPFIKVKAIWDEIFANAGFTAEGDILTDERFLKLFMPIVDLNMAYIDTKPLMYSLKAFNRKVMNQAENLLDLVSAQVVATLGDVFFTTMGMYITRVAATYTFQVTFKSYAPFSGLTYPLEVYLYVDGIKVADFYDDGTYGTDIWYNSFKVTYPILSGHQVTFRCSICGVQWYTLQVIDIQDAKIGYGSSVVAHYHLPDLSQTEFIKMICNLFGLIPETNPRDRKIKFWNYRSLYENIPNARDWSAYLSERDDTVEFKFGEYAQRNYMRYKESDDVVKDTGTGVMQIEDENLPFEKDVIDLEISTCDEVIILTDVRVSRIAFNKYNLEDHTYDQEKSIDPRLVYVDEIVDPYVSPPYTKEFGFRDNVIFGSGALLTVETPKKASSLEVAFSTLSEYYDSFENMLNQTNLRRCKFNLPAYEVAGFKHDVPIYVRQYKSYFYVNKISNYVQGKLCTVELIKL